MPTLTAMPRITAGVSRLVTRHWEPVGLPIRGAHWMVTAEELAGNVLVFAGARRARREPLVVGGEDGVDLSFLDQLGRRVALDSAQAPELGQGDDRGSLAAEVDHLERFLRGIPVCWLRGHRENATAGGGLAGRGARRRAKSI